MEEQYTLIKKNSHAFHKRTFALIPVILAMIWAILPFYVMVVGALKPTSALSVLPADLNPFTNLRLNNFAAAIKTAKLGRGFKNSLIISAYSCIITVFIGMMGGYAFAKRSFRGKKIWFTVLMISMMLPNQVMMIPRYTVANNLHLDNTLIGVVLTSLNSAYAVFVCRQFIASIPDELLHASRLDGCSELQAFIHVVLPLSKPVISMLTIFTFITSWNDYIWQNIMLTKGSLRTIPLALSHLLDVEKANTLSLQFAGATLSAIPMIAIFFCVQKYFIKGISDGAVKE